MIANSQGRLQDRRPLSIIDIGSNSIRLVVYEGVARSPTVLFNEKMLAGLGPWAWSTTGSWTPKRSTRRLRSSALPGAVGPGRRREASRHRHGRGARSRERARLHPPRRRDPRRAHPRAFRPRGSALFGAWRHFRLSPGQRHRRGPRRRQPRTRRRQPRGHRRRHHLAARRPATAGHGEGIIRQAAQHRQARAGRAKLLQGRRGHGSSTVSAAPGETCPPPHECDRLPARRHASLRAPGDESSAAFLRRVARGDIEGSRA